LHEDGITVPAKEKEGIHLTDEQKAWKKWVSGFWLETLINHWMTDTCLNKQSIVRNLKVKDKTSQDVVEVDFLMLYKNNMSMIEAKVSPPGKADSVNKIIKDINAINSLGNLKKYLMISPLFEKKMQLKPKEREDFHERCRFYNIVIIRSKDDLLQAFEQ